MSYLITEDLYKQVKKALVSSTEHFSKSHVLGPISGCPGCEGVVERNRAWKALKDQVEPVEGISID